jgi:heterogeneous nuclear rnp K-like protein 2
MSQPSNNSDNLDDRHLDQSPYNSQQDGTSHPEEDDGFLTLRALVSTKEAGVLIGKGNMNVLSHLRGKGSGLN